MDRSRLTWVAVGGATIALTCTATALVLAVPSVVLSSGREAADSSLVTGAMEQPSGMQSTQQHGAGDSHFGEDFWTYVMREQPEVSRPEVATVRYFGFADIAPVLANCLNERGFESARAIGNGGIAWNVPGDDQADAFNAALFACRVQHPFVGDTE